MKQVLQTAVLLFSLLVISAGAANAQLKIHRICFFDDGGGKFLFTDIQTTGTDTYSSIGSYNGYPDGTAYMSLDLSRGRDFGVTEIHVANGRPDGCTFYSDSFTLYGTVLIYKPASDTEYWYLSGGTWQSYCGGVQLFVGNWTGIGPCKNFTAAAAAKKDLLPTKGRGETKVKADDFSMKIIPNPIKNNTQVTYKLASPGKVTITVYDFMSRPVKVLTNEYKTAGNYSISWNAIGTTGSRVPSGLYKIVITSGNKTASSTLQVE